MLVLIGNSPSSGSTFLADLLDSTPVSASGPELGLFTSKALYDFTGAARQRLRPSGAASVYCQRVGLNADVLHSYGLNPDVLTEMLQDAKAPSSFFTEFARRYLILRGRESDGVVFEKTPQNVNTVTEFLESGGAAARFVHVVRNPAFVYRSLRRRGFPPYVALATWMVDTAKMMALQGDERVITIRYEALTEAPYAIAGALASQLSGREVSAETVERLYRGNLYRDYHEPRIASWSSRKVGETQNANASGLSDADRAVLAGALSVRINPQYAALFGLADARFIDLLRHYGYEREFSDLVQGAEPQGCGDDILARRRLAARWVRAVVRGWAGFKDRRAFLSPVIPIARS